MRASLCILLMACSGDAAEGSEPTTEAVFHDFNPVHALSPLVANLSSSTCVVVWPAETDHRASFVFVTEDEGATFEERPELPGTAQAALAVGDTIVVLKESTGGGVLSSVLVSEDVGSTWMHHGSVREALLPHQTSDRNQVDQLAFLDARTGRARWNESQWLVTDDGGESWAVVQDKPDWEPLLPSEGPCRVEEGVFERASSAGWEPVPGAPTP